MTKGWLHKYRTDVVRDGVKLGTVPHFEHEQADKLAGRPTLYQKREGMTGLDAWAYIAAPLTEG